MQLILVFLFSTITAFAYQSSLSATDNELHWASPVIPMAIQNETSDMASITAKNIILSSMNEWNQSTSAKVNVVSSSSNTIKFVPNFPYGSAVIGVTEISFNNSGSISKANIFLNDDYYFHSTPGMYPAGQVYLGDVVTHELGHMFGLSHSEVLNSTMFYSSFSGQSVVSPDDIAGIRAKYDNFGSISGFVKGGSSVGVLGAHVQAISRNSGEAIGVISDETGYFRISGLDLNDTYYLYTSPVKNSDSLPGYFANTQDNFCPGSYVGSMFSACGREHDGKPTPIALTDTDPDIDVGTISISCGLRSDQDYDYQKLQTSFQTLTILDYASEQRTEKAFTGWFRKTSSTSWSAYDVFKIDLSAYPVSGTSKYLKIALASFPFGSLLEYEMTVKKNGAVVGSSSRGLTYSSTTETYNTDFYSYLPLSTSTSQNVFEVSIRSRKLSSSYASQTFPSVLKFTSDQHMPYLLMASVYENTPAGLTALTDTQANWSDNEACLDAPFTYAVSKAKETTGAASSTADQDQTVASSAGCGTIEPPRNGPGNSFPLMTAGFLLVLLASSLRKSRKNFLS